MAFEDERSTVAITPPAMSPDGVVLSVLSGPAKGRFARLPARSGQSVTVGKAAANDLVLDDESVSRRHMSLTRLESGIELVDHESKNGTFVGNMRVSRAIIEPGALLRVGSSELLVAVALANVVLPPSERDRFGLVVGKSLEMRRIFGVLERIAPTDATVLLTGETGTGKDALARALHLSSRRARGPFEVVDCGAVTPSLIESELFGHERGAFTGALAARTGAFERAAGGTIFLDELGELSLELQPKLLRVLEAKELRRVGGNRTLATDVRVVAATTRNLESAVAAGTFREDLFFRLAVVPIHVPPLRARREDVDAIVATIVAAVGQGLVPDDEALGALRTYDWPGNIRELRNVLERSAHVSRAVGSARLELVDFPPRRAAREDALLTSATFDEGCELWRDESALRDRVRKQVRGVVTGALLGQRLGRRARRPHGQKPPLRSRSSPRAGPSTVSLQHESRVVIGPLIASGGMGSVHLGRLRGSTGFERTVAVKRLHPAMARSQEFVDMFRDEARLSARIRHANVVAVRDVVVTGDDEIALVMDFVDGAALATILRTLAVSGGKVPPSIARSVIIDVLRGLHAAHEATAESGEPLRLVHRDVSPQNVMIGTDGLARVVDFGIAKAEGRIAASTQGDALKGKLRYMAPELFQGHDPTLAADLHAVAVVLWEMLTGAPLYAGTDAAVVEQILYGSFRPPSAMVPGLPVVLDAFLARGLARDPADRFASAGAMAEVLASGEAPARHAEVGRWLAATVGDELRAGTARLAQFERELDASSRTSPVPAPSVALPPQAAIDEHTVTFLSSSWEPRRPRRMALHVGIVVAATALAIGAAAFRFAPAHAPVLASVPSSRSEPATDLADALVPPTSAPTQADAASTPTPDGTAPARSKPPRRSSPRRREADALPRGLPVERD